MKQRIQLAIFLIGLLLAPQSWAQKTPQFLAPGSFTDLAKKVDAAVVNISTTKSSAGVRSAPRQQMPRNPYQNPQDEWEEFFDRFFGGAPNGPQGKQRSLGSGFIWDETGYIVTNYHVVGNVDQIKVQLADKRQFDAKVIGLDKKTDLALIKIDTKEKLPYVQLGDSNLLDIGQWVVAIGNPFGLGHTLTAGIVSAKGRVLNLGPYDDFIQTDASINPGNSGGPLFNLNGEVVGINTAIVASGQGIGFAIPVNMAKDLLPQLKRSGKVVRGWLGVMVQEVDPDLAEAFKLKNTSGALVAEVLDKSPAERAGIRQGDIIKKFDSREIKDVNDLPRIVAGTAVGKDVPMEILRDGKPVKLSVKIEQLQEEKEATLAKAGAKDSLDQLGLVLQEITPDIAAQLKANKGLLVKEVMPDTPAEDAGLRRGDVIVEVNQTPVVNVQEFKKALKRNPNNATSAILIKRDGNTRYLALKAAG